MYSTTRFALSLFLAVGLGGCSARGPLDVVPRDANEETLALAQVADDLGDLEGSTNAELQAPDIEFVGRGYSQVSQQPGSSLNERRLMAIRAARLEAMRDLTEQIHGVRISSTSSLRDAVLRDDRLMATVDGELRGARTVSITPNTSDTFEVVLSLDPDTVRYILRAVRAGI